MVSALRSRLDADFLKFFLFDVLVATIVGFVSFIVTKDQISSLVISLVIGSILLLVELRFQLAKTKDDLEESIGFQRSALEDAALRDGLRRLVGGYTSVVRNNDPRFVARARTLLADAANELVHLQEGFIDVPQSDMYEQAISLARSARQRFDAHSLVEDNDFWFRGAGKQYLDENLAAVKRGVTVSRVFIVATDADITGPSRDLIQLQLDGGIDVRIAFARNLSRDLLVDFFVVDGKYALYWDLVPGTREMRGGRLTINETELRRGQAIHDRLFKEAEPASSVLARIAPRPTDPATAKLTPR